MEQNDQNRAYNIAANMLVNMDKTSYETKQVLLAEGFEDKQIDQIIENINDEIEAATRKQGRRDMIVGGLWCVGGLVVTIATYSASSGGGRYVVAWGAIIFGAIQFFRGLSKLA